MFAAPESRLTRSFYELTGKYTNRNFDLPAEKKGLFERILTATSELLFGKRKV